MCVWICMCSSGKQNRVELHLRVDRMIGNYMVNIMFEGMGIAVWLSNSLHNYMVSDSGIFGKYFLLWLSANQCHCEWIWCMKLYKACYVFMCVGVCACLMQVFALYTALKICLLQRVNVCVSLSTSCLAAQHFWRTSEIKDKWNKITSLDKRARVNNNSIPL